MKPRYWKTTAQRGVSKAMELQCGSLYVQVNPDASHLVARPTESGISFASGRGFSGPASSADTGGRPPAPTLLVPHDCRHSSSTAAHDRSASTPPPGIRICRSTAIVRRPWARRLSHGSTSDVRVGLKSPILIRWGSFPVAAAGLVSYTVFGPAAGLFLSNGLSLSPLSDSPTSNQATNHDHSTTITLVHHTKVVAVFHSTDRLDSRPRLMTLSNHTKPRATARIARVLDTVHKLSVSFPR